jgi:cobalt transporter subunit CbtA
MQRTTCAIPAVSPATKGLMPVFRSIVFSALIVGVAVGVIVTIAQLFGTAPLIIHAEVFERATKKVAATPPVAPAAHDHAEHEDGEAAWQPREGLERNSFTAAANVLTSVGFALVLAAIYALQGRTIAWHEGLLWGLCGFLVCTIAPGLGLPPELPGVPAAPLAARQTWWIGAAAATAVGLWLLVLRRSPWSAVLGLCLIATPHVIGAPQVEDVHTQVPQTLSHQFIVAVTLISFLSWALLGALTSIVYRRVSVVNPA